MSSTSYADFYFIAAPRKQSTSDRRLDGYFVIPAEGFSCKACSGSTSLYPLPAGQYACTNFRVRTNVAMVRGGIGFSVDLEDKWDPALNRQRKLLRIHPDGNLPGSEGCVAILDRVKQCRDLLKAWLPKGETCWLNVQIVPSREDFYLETQCGMFIWA